MEKETHVIDSLPAYALGILDGEEERQVSEHLSQCNYCTGELEAYRVVASQLALGAPDAQPSSRLKQAIVERAQSSIAENRPLPRAREMEYDLRPSARLGWLDQITGFLHRAAPVWGVVSLVLVIALIASNVILFRQVQRQNQLMNHFQLVALAGTTSAPDARGVMIISPDGLYGTLVVDGLPDLAAGKQYQLWLNRDKERVSGGVFNVGWTGYSALKIDPKLPLSHYTRFGITIEPTGGSQGPTGARVLGGGA